MARNIEIKARIESVEVMAPKAAALADQGPIALSQDDTFFPCPHGRLKLRAFSATAGQLIFYQRPNQKWPKESSFILAPTAGADSVRAALSRASGQDGRVAAERRVS